jgi:hypothetical protein
LYFYHTENPSSQKTNEEYGPVAGIQGREGGTSALLHYCIRRHTDKKENQIFLIYKEIQNGAVAKSYMTKGLLIYEEIFAHFLTY